MQPLILVRKRRSLIGVLMKALGSARNRWQCTVTVEGVTSKRFAVACSCCLWMEHDPNTKEPLIKPTIRQLHDACRTHHIDLVAIRRADDASWCKDVAASGLPLRTREFNPYSDFRTFHRCITVIDREAEHYANEAWNRRLRSGWRRR